MLSGYHCQRVAERVRSALDAKRASGIAARRATPSAGRSRRAARIFGLGHSALDRRQDQQQAARAPRISTSLRFGRVAPASRSPCRRRQWGSRTADNYRGAAATFFLSLVFAHRQCAPLAHEHDVHGSIVEERAAGDARRVAICAHPRPGSRERSGLFCFRRVNADARTALGERYMNSMHSSFTWQPKTIALCEADLRASRTEEIF